MTASSETHRGVARGRSPARFTLLGAARLLDGGDGPPVADAVLLMDGDRVAALGAPLCFRLRGRVTPTRVGSRSVRDHEREDVREP